MLFYIRKYTFLKRRSSLKKKKKADMEKFARQKGKAHQICYCRILLFVALRTMIVSPWGVDNV